MNGTGNKIRSRNELIEWTNEGNKVKYLFFWGHTPPSDNSINRSCFSQWFPANFEIDGIIYKTAEHFMMAEKARLFGDHLRENRIIESPDPHHAKKLGRLVQNYNDQKWKEHRFHIVVNGNLAKFSQNPEFADFLITTGQRVLVEAAPRDCIWGIGLGAQNPKAENPNQWRGQNLLGFALMEVRDQLLKH